MRSLRAVSGHAMPSRWPIKAARQLVAPLISCFLLGYAEATGAHAIAQAYTFRIRRGGKVDVQMDIEFQVAQGETLGGSYKSILDSIDFKAIENHKVTARDSLGKDVNVVLKDVAGWVQAKFSFPQPVRGDGSTRYSIRLSYTILGGICSATESFRFHLPWAHRWIVPVTRSTYRIEFPDSVDAAKQLNQVCLAGTGFNRRCGRAGLELEWASAQHIATGFLHGLFFQWPRGLLPGNSSAVTRSCPSCGAEDGCLPETSSASAHSKGEMMPQKEDIKTSTFSTVAVALAIVLCCLLAVVSALLRRKIQQWGPAETKGESAPLDALPPCIPHSKFEDEDECMEEGMCEDKGENLDKFDGEDDDHMLSGRIVGQELPRRTPSPTSIGSSTTADTAGHSTLQGINIEIDDLPIASMTPPTGPSSPSGDPEHEAWEQAKRHWQGFGQLWIDSPEGGSSPSSSKEAQRLSPSGVNFPASVVGASPVIPPYVSPGSTESPHVEFLTGEASGLASVLEEEEEEDELGPNEAAV